MDSIQHLCSRCETPLETGDLRCSICGQAAPQVTTAQQKTIVKILRCSGCGAAVAYDPKRQAPSCSFCDSVVKIETIEDPMEQTEGYLPFTLTRDEARAALKNWLGSLGWFRPSDLRSSARLHELRPLWWVAWVFDADSMISWTADSNADARRSAWAPHAGQTNVSFRSILASASRGLSNKEVELMSRGLDLSSVRDDPLGADDATFEQFDVQRSQARRQVTETLHALAERRVRETQVPGNRFRNVHVSVVVQGLITRRLSLPAYVLAYRYKQNLYRVVICGQDGQVISGTAPYSTAKIVLVAFSVITFLIVILGLIAATQ